MMRLRDLPETVRRRLETRNSKLETRNVGRRTSDEKRRGGRRAHQAGAALQRAVVRAAGEQHTIVELAELPPCGARFVGKGRAHHLPIDCDFHGSIVGPGTGLFFDAKSMRRELASLALGDEKIVKKHQRDFLHRQALAGAIAGLLVEHAGPAGAGGLFRWLDGRHLVCREGRLPAIKWEDPRWILLGESIDFRRLLTAYGHA